MDVLCTPETMHNYKAVRHEIDTYKHLSGNCDGFAIREVHKMLAKYPSAKKVFFNISDGAPTEKSTSGMGAKAETVHELDEMKRDGILVINVGICGMSDISRLQSDFAGYPYLHGNTSDQFFKDLQRILKVHL
jgi:nitric oxide reductase activation protein